MMRHLRYDERGRPMLLEMSEQTSVSYDVIVRIKTLDKDAKTPPGPCPVVSFETADKMTAALGEFQAFEQDCPLYRSPFMTTERYFAIMKERGCTKEWSKTIPKLKI
jgi:hypothetical protein